jgi:RNA polymerase sigma-70 factor (ECF subfamily)
MNAKADNRSDNRGLVAQMRPALVRYFKRKTGSPVEAEDLAQDVLVRVLAHASWKTPSEAKGYVFRAAINRWHDLYRRNRARGTRVAWNEEEIGELGTHNPPERVVIVMEELGQIDRALEEMNVRTRTVLMLVRLEQMKAATVADMLGISLSAVNKHLAKGVARLAELRRQEDGES